MANEKVNIFTAAMRTEFINEYSVVAAPAPAEQIYGVVPSNTRVENYAWMSPTPGMGEWQGHRRFGKIGETKYKVENKVYDGAFEVLIDDVDDDQTGGYKLKAQELARKSKLFRGREVCRIMAANGVCFDGSNFFADSHTIGTGDNNMTYNAAASGGETNKIVAFVTAGPIKPMFWQDRSAPKLMTDAGTPESEKSRMLRYWAELRGAVGFGYWWDAILMTITDIPTLVEMQEILGQIEARFRTFRLPVAHATDTPEYVHEQVEFNPSNLVLVCSTGITHLVRQVLGESQISNSSNPYKGYASYFSTGFLN